MKLHEGDNVNDAEESVNDYLAEIKDIEDVVGFISCVILENGKTKTIVAANVEMMLMFAEELVKVALSIKEYEANHEGSETIQ